jgi:polysaccharide lyase-like protein
MRYCGELMVNRYAVLLLALALSFPISAYDRKVYFTGDFESGLIPSKGSKHDGFYIATLPDPQSGSTTLCSGDSTFGPSTAADTRVVASDVVGGEKILPRSGNYFIRTEVFREKNYLELNDWTKNRPRSKIYMSDPTFRIDFDQEGYVGFSIYTPKNFENELGVRDHRGAATLFEMSSDDHRSLTNLGVWVQSPAVEAHWFLRIYTNDQSVLEDDNHVQVVDLGPVNADIGRWTDFVVRYRWNPFSVTTNPADKGISDSKDQVYEGKKGILQLWKAEGPVGSDGNRKLALKVDKVNQPVGLVPHSTEKIRHYWRIYKFGWLSNPTTLTHSVWFGFDEIRQGLVNRDGTTFADVVPAGNACESCGSSDPSKPKAPSNLTVE